MVNLIGINVAVERMVERGGDPLAVAGVLGRSPLLANHPNVGHATREASRPARLHRWWSSTRTSLTSARKTNGPREIAVTDSTPPRLLNTA